MPFLCPTVCPQVPLCPPARWLCPPRCWWWAQTRPRPAPGPFPACPPPSPPHPTPPVFGLVSSPDPLEWGTRARNTNPATGSSLPTCAQPAARRAARGGGTSPLPSMACTKSPWYSWLRSFSSRLKPRTLTISSTSDKSSFSSYLWRSIGRCRDPTREPGTLLRGLGVASHPGPSTNRCKSLAPPAPHHCNLSNFAQMPKMLKSRKRKGARTPRVRQRPTRSPSLLYLWKPWKEYLGALPSPQPSNVLSFAHSAGSLVM
jgi:hypothetical protein